MIVCDLCRKGPARGHRVEVRDSLGNCLYWHAWDLCVDCASRVVNRVRDGLVGTDGILGQVRQEVMKREGKP